MSDNIRDISSGRSRQAKPRLTTHCFEIGVITLPEEYALLFDKFADRYAEQFPEMPITGIGALLIMRALDEWDRGERFKENLQKLKNAPSPAGPLVAASARPACSACHGGAPFYTFTIPVGKVLCQECYFQRLPSLTRRRLIEAASAVIKNENEGLADIDEFHAAAEAAVDAAREAFNEVT